MAVVRRLESESGDVHENHGPMGEFMCELSMGRVFFLLKSVEPTTFHWTYHGVWCRVSVACGLTPIVHGDHLPTAPIAKCLRLINDQEPPFLGRFVFVGGKSCVLVQSRVVFRKQD